MRRRSGGLHCQTQEQLIQLAQLSQQKCGLYYDDQLNKKRNQTLSKHHKTSQKQKINQTNLQKNKAFADFDFNEDDIEKNQEKNELKKQTQVCAQKNITIICSFPGKVRKMFEYLMQHNKQKKYSLFQSFSEIENLYQRYSESEMSIQQPQNSALAQEERLLDLYIHQIEDKDCGRITSYKFWFLKNNGIQAEICKTYLNYANFIYKLKQNSQSEQLNLRLPQNGKRHIMSDVSNIQQIIQQVILKKK